MPILSAPAELAPIPSRDDAQGGWRNWKPRNRSVHGRFEAAPSPGSLTANGSLPTSTGCTRSSPTSIDCSPMCAVRSTSRSPSVVTSMAPTQQATQRTRPTDHATRPFGRYTDTSTRYSTARRSRTHTRHGEIRSSRPTGSPNVCDAVVRAPTMSSGAD